jgi:hypothetical protein
VRGAKERKDLRGGRCLLRKVTSEKEPPFLFFSIQGPVTRGSESAFFYIVISFSFSFPKFF